MRCGTDALKEVFRSGNNFAGEFGTRHGMITRSRFAVAAYDWEISLYADSPKNIIGKSLVVRQGNNEPDYRCATIQPTSLHSLRPGAIPCKRVHYTDCLVGTAREDLCIFKPCYGYRHYWGPVERSTLLCAQTYERYPKQLRMRFQVEGAVSCIHGNHTLLKPFVDSSWL